ncbi:hypothetical protein DPMN_055707 [Dreissena polymorpha]|uniref:Uncharacterized protein n=1 Tax=Dreissena polymorpha TaxID=45954 RepID=A0A9D4HSI8_DREPO|nr:hypothetical protein DPMN_055707 [Dreissena polymorpha]
MDCPISKRRATLSNHTLKESSVARIKRLKYYRCATCRFAKYRNVIWISCKSLYVIMNPFDSEVLIPKSLVTRKFPIGALDESEHTDSVINCNHDDFTKRTDAFPWVYCGCALYERSSVNPNHHRKRHVLLKCMGNKNVEIQTVFCEINILSILYFASQMRRKARHRILGSVESA